MELKFDVKGMTCAACSARVEKVTKEVPGVDTAEVNLLVGKMRVVCGEDNAHASRYPNLLRRWDKRRTELFPSLGRKV